MTVLEYAGIHGYWLPVLTSASRCKPMKADLVRTIKDVAKLLKVSEKTVYSMAKKGELPAFRVRNQWRIRREDLEVWITSQSARNRSSKNTEQAGFEEALNARPGYLRARAPALQAGRTLLQPRRLRAVA